jgi:hypothetical protein
MSGFSSSSLPMILSSTSIPAKKDENQSAAVSLSQGSVPQTPISPPLEREVSVANSYLFLTAFL